MGGAKWSSGAKQFNSNLQFPIGCESFAASSRLPQVARARHCTSTTPSRKSTDSWTPSIPVSTPSVADGHFTCALKLAVFCESSLRFGAGSCVFTTEVCCVKKYFVPCLKMLLTFCRIFEIRWCLFWDSTI